MLGRSSKEPLATSSSQRGGGASHIPIGGGKPCMAQPVLLPMPFGTM